MVGVVYPAVVIRVERAKLAVLYNRSYVVFRQTWTRFVPIGSLVSGDRLDPVKISFENLPADISCGCFIEHYISMVRLVEQLMSAIVFTDLNVYFVGFA